jgi:hypothetical protein
LPGAAGIPSRIFRNLHPAQDVLLLDNQLDELPEVGKIAFKQTRKEKP